MHSVCVSTQVYLALDLARTRADVFAAFALPSGSPAGGRTTAVKKAEKDTTAVKNTADAAQQTHTHAATIERTPSSLVLLGVYNSVVYVYIPFSYTPSCCVRVYPPLNVGVGGRHSRHITEEGTHMP